MTRFGALVVLLAVAVPAVGELGDPDSQAVFTVDCDGIATRTVEVDIYLAPGAPRGALVFSAGGDGRGTYTKVLERAKTVEELRDFGFDAYVLRSGDVDGWYTGGGGHGLRGITCVYAEAVRWVEQNAANPDVMCAQGNSSATVFIAYGVQEHGLDGLLDLALVTSGPSGTLPIELCEGTVGHPSQQARGGIEFAQGWPPGTCTGQSPLTQPQRDQLLIDALAYRENLVHETPIWSMMDENDKSRTFAEAWFDTMVPPTLKRMDFFQNLGHKFDQTPEGADRVRRVLRSRCK